MKRVTIIANPTAGRGRAGKQLAKITTQLAHGFADAHVELFSAPDFSHAQAKSQQTALTAAPEDIMVVVGGDGMMNVGLNACAGTPIRLGLIPAGTGNDVCRGFDLEYSDPHRAVSNMVRGNSRQIDLLSVRGNLTDGAAERQVGSIVCTGFDAAVNIRGNRSRLPIRSMRYLAGVIAEVGRFNPLPYRISIDGESVETEAMLIAVGNSRYFGGGIEICPKADVTDGKLDLTIIRTASKADLIRFLPSLRNGKFIRHPAVELRQGRHVVIDGDGLYGMGDGEELGPPPLDIAIRPGAVNILGFTD